MRAYTVIGSEMGTILQRTFMADSPEEAAERHWDCDQYDNCNSPVFVVWDEGQCYIDPYADTTGEAPPED